MFECFSPCIKCAEQGFTYDANSRFCQKCQFFILVHVVEKVVSKNPECKYCKLEKDCTSPCDFVFDFEKLISEYAEHLENKRQFYKDLEEDSEEWYEPSEEDVVVSFSDDESESIFFERAENGFFDSFMDGFDDWLNDDIFN